MTEYVPITLNDFSKTMGDMGFVTHSDHGSEVVFERDVTTRSGIEYPYSILVYSSISTRTGVSHEAGSDAIRVVLMDKKTGRPAAGKQRRIHRTKNALGNLRKRCREIFKKVMESKHCPCCSAMMVVRENRKTGHEFLSCSRYAPGKSHHCDYTMEIDT